MDPEQFSDLLFHLGELQVVGDQIRDAVWCVAELLALLFGWSIFVVVMWWCFYRGSPT